jgi:hypothetical protein
VTAIDVCIYLLTQATDHRFHSMANLLFVSWLDLFQMSPEQGELTADSPATTSSMPTPFRESAEESLRTTSAVAKPVTNVQPMVK